MFDIFAITTRGLENVSAQEIAEIPGGRVTRVEYRRVHATFSGNAGRLLELRTVDDLFALLAEWHGIQPQRSQLGSFEQLAAELDLWQAMNIREDVNTTAVLPSSSVTEFSVTANFVGRRNYNADEIKNAVARGIESISGWRYVEDDRHSDVNIRVFIEHERATVGMRLGKSPLHRRAYKQEHRPGSLKPSVAAALVRLAHTRPGSTLLDPCCGAGTILIEAAAMNLRASGGDHDPAAVAAAQENALAAAAPVDVQLWDARSLPIPSASIDYIVSNLPWGRQIEVDSALIDFYSAACAEMERVLVEGGRIVLLTSLAHLVSFSSLALEQSFEISLFGQQPAVLVFGPASPSPPLSTETLEAG